MAIPAQEQDLIRRRFDAALRGPVKIDFFFRRKSELLVPGREPCPTCADVQAMLHDLAALSPRITLTLHDIDADPRAAQKWGIEGVPATVVRGERNRPLRFYGRPAGVLFPLLLDLIALVTVEPPRPDEETRRLLKKLRQPATLDILGLPGLPSWADATRIGMELALISPRIRATAYEIAEYLALARSLGLQTLPVTVVNDRHGFPGVASAREVARFLLALEQDPATAGEHAPQPAPGSFVPWTPPAPPQSPGPPGPRPGTPGPPPGERRTAGGLILPGR